VTRTPLWDNARFLIIVLVVIGHGVQRQGYDSNLAYGVYLLIYSFHMPLMLLLAGWFSREVVDGDRLKRIVSDLIVPYVIFQTIWSVLQWLVSGSRPFDYAQPKWTLWFLVALAIMRTLLPILALLRPWIRWSLVIGVALACGWWAGVDSTFALSRTLGMMPFFLLGWELARAGAADPWLSGSRRMVNGIRIAAAGVLIVAAALAVGSADALRDFGIHRWFFMDDGYRALGVDEAWAPALRLGLLGVTLVMSAAFMALVPRRQTGFTAFGQATMYVYLLHTFALWPLRESGILRGAGSDPQWVLLVAIGAVLLAVLLSTKPIRTVFRPLVSPRTSWLFRAPTTVRN